MTLFRRLVWACLDPVLLRVRSRLEHLDEISPSTTFRRRLELLACIDPSAQLDRGVVIRNNFARDRIRIGPYSYIAGEIGVFREDAQVTIGSHCFVGSGTHVWAQREVRIGNRVLIAHLVDIHDTDAHSLNAHDRRRDPVALFEKGRAMDWSRVEASPVRILDDAWIGMKSVVLKGVTIGEGAVVAAASVVTRDVEPYTLVGGSPARKLRDLKQEPP